MAVLARLRVGACFDKHFAEQVEQHIDNYRVASEFVLCRVADACILHEGTRADVIDALKGWYEIRLADGTEGWISEKDVEVIE